MPDLEAILNRLIAGEVEFVVIGGFAAMAHGSAMEYQSTGGGQCAAIPDVG